MLISPEYLKLQKELHSRGSYGISAGKWADAVDDLARRLPAASVLDYGCGRGFLWRELSARDLPYSFHEYDPAIAGYEAPPESADLVYCGDVLEHIEPDYLDAVLDHIAKVARKAVFLVIATCPAVKTLADGRNAHLIVDPAWVWMTRLDKRWNVMGFGGNGGEFQWIGRAK